MTSTEAMRPHAACHALPSPPSTARIAGFDGLRALAFLAVFANHKLDFPQGDAFGALGVWAFFVLSGFLITGILARSRAAVEAGRTSIGEAFRRFYLRRTARIFPPYYALIAGALILSIFVDVDDFWVKEKLAYIFYATNILIALRGAWPGDFAHLWSLAIEEQYYLLFAPLVLLLPRRRTAAACLAMIAAALVADAGLRLARAHSLSIYVNSLVNFGMLGLGGLVGLAASCKPPGWMPAWLMGGWAQAAVVAALVAMPLAWGADFKLWLALAPVVAAAAGLLLFQVYNRQQSWFVAVLDSAPLRLTGRVSYAAYLFHPFVRFSILHHLLAAAGVQLQAPRPVQILGELAGTLVLCAISWRLIERPVIRWARRLSDSAAAGTDRRSLNIDARGRRCGGAV